MKIAIIGAGPSGLACAIECERLGIIPDVFERDKSIGWIWPSITVNLNLFDQDMGDINNYLYNKFGIDLLPLHKCKSFTLKSPNKETRVEGKLGYFFARGKDPNSIENQLLNKLEKTPVHYNSPADYKELAKKYDYVVVATGIDTTAKELDVWEQKGLVHMYGGLAVGKFSKGTSTLYFNTEYAGTGYARVTPYNSTQAIVKVYNFDCKQSNVDSLFTKFLEIENLTHLQFLFKLTPPMFSVGKVKKFQVGNVLLTGRAAGLTERLVGVGASFAIASGVYAARAMIKGKDYDTLITPLQEHIENISAFRDAMKNIDNDGFDRAISMLGTPGIKQAIYNTGINFTDMGGLILKNINKLLN